MRAANRMPLTMRTVFQDLLLITHAVSPQKLSSLLPPPIHPYVHNGRSYISIVIGNMRGMRPHPLPEALSTNYYQIVYRAVVYLRHKDGSERPGVFFLRSDANDPIMSFFGNRMSEFRFHYFQTGAIGLFHRDKQLLTSVETLDRKSVTLAPRRHGSLRRCCVASVWPTSLAAVERRRETRDDRDRVPVSRMPPG